MASYLAGWMRSGVLNTRLAMYGCQLGSGMDVSRKMAIKNPVPGDSRAGFVVRTLCVRIGFKNGKASFYPLISENVESG
uniref:Uncharacterized protein n=1 Tax=Candidatus Kentrum eta TaxID=2126337 RepID=A0A450UG41_9GAMM|nr:MAG: hypothetical protein BECKH772A_GA0070896_1003218 [Candidatus Kentron sp. H]VFJ92574.1 MAG: hypothetical protein BECKH772B_GA0070898_1003116 [Candidatus Kentron sp. H]VFJ99387.1 MAG: hypothetical protein BECKH772C_GA0070978_1003119 [Candidatus Kentron sp. H]